MVFKMRKTWANFSIDLTLKQTYAIRKDHLETFLDVIIRVAEQSYAFKTWASFSIDLTLTLWQTYVVGKHSLETFLDIIIGAAEKSYVFKTRASTGIDSIFGKLML
jgi:hypothetical protein